MPTSPGVYTYEYDYTTTVPSVSAEEGGFAGVFGWGPVGELILVTNEASLVQRFGKPTASNYETFFTAQNFLSYTDKLFISRAIESNTYNAVANATGAVANLATQVVKNKTHYETVTFDANVAYVAKYPGSIGNSLKISTCDSVNAYSRDIALVANASVSSNASLTYFSLAAGSNSATISVTSAANATVASATMTGVLGAITVGDLILVGNTSVGTQYMKVTAKGSSADTSNGGNYTTTATLSFASTLNLISNVSSQTIARKWEFFQNVDKAPGVSEYSASLGSTVVDEIHAVVIDEDGKFSGTVGKILEVFPAMSRSTDAKDESGQSSYYKTVLNTVSQYVWCGTESSGAASNVAGSVVASTNYTPLTISFGSGADGVTESNITVGALATAWDFFRNKEDIDVSVLMMGKARGGDATATTLFNYVSNNIGEGRKDLVVCGSAPLAYAVNNVNYLNDMQTWRNACVSSSYNVFDSGYKYQYDKYNDVFRWVPLNGDIAGIIAACDPAWFSPAGSTRGIIKNVTKLGYNPSEAERDILFKADINPCVTFPGEGTMLFGDKTGLGKPSAFGAINVRRLFITLKKAIARAARSQLFEINDEFAQRQFKAIVEPYLKDVKGKRGIYAFEVVCDGRNNTAEVIDRFEFVGDILIKPSRASRYIVLNFIGLKTGADFSEFISAVQ